MRVLVTGAGGQLGRDLADAFSGRVPTAGRAHDPATGRLGARPVCDVVAADHGRLDVSDRGAVLAAVEGVRPHVVVHAGAWTAVDACESDPDRAFAVNALGTRHVAEAARRWGAHLVYVSTDYVFDGTATRPYVEWDRTNPLSVYGRSKLAGELELDPGSTVVRTSWVCGAHGSNMVRTVLRLASTPGALRFVDDQRGSPTFTADLAGAICVLAADRLPGTFHVTNAGVTSWYEFARAVLAAAGHDPARVEPIATAELDPPRPAPRPANSVLDNAALRLMGMPALPDWHDALGRLVDALGADWSAPPAAPSPGHAPAHAAPAPAPAAATARPGGSR
ncbi:MAG TPA: dTDP-4-dehydrorhamnose reductase [Acidimicrobiales bacterium]|nr:dTDP-4-dehydrorhamnose reductase [Acidimicrobiales bacterium]